MSKVDSVNRDLAKMEKLSSIVITKKGVWVSGLLALLMMFIAYYMKDSPTGYIMLLTCIFSIVSCSTTVQNYFILIPMAREIKRLSDELASLRERDEKL